MAYIQKGLLDPPYPRLSFTQASIATQTPFHPFHFTIQSFSTS